MSHFVVATHCLNKPLDDTVLWTTRGNNRNLTYR